MPSSDHQIESSSGPRTVEEVRALYQPATDYRISAYSYPMGAEFSGSGKSGNVHVLSGSCEFRFKAKSVALSAGQHALLPSGTYTFEVVGPNAVELVHVRHLPSLWTDRMSEESR
jgi:hypothetical protein